MMDTMMTIFLSSPNFTRHNMISQGNVLSRLKFRQVTISWSGYQVKKLKATQPGYYSNQVTSGNQVTKLPFSSGLVQCRQVTGN